MDRLSVANLGKTYVVSDNGDTIDVNDSSVLPENDPPFKVVLTETRTDPVLSDIEIVLVEAVDTANDQLQSLTRAQEGTTQGPSGSSTWPADTYCENRGTRDFTEQLSENLFDADGKKVAKASDGYFHVLDKINDDQGNLIYDYVNQYIPDSVLQKIWAADRDAGDNSLTNLLLQNFTDATEKTISSGAITADQTLHTVDTEGDASSDDIVTINGGSNGDLLYLRAASGSRTVVLKHGTGNIVTPDGSDYSLDNADKIVSLIYTANSNWQLVGSVAGGGGSNAFSFFMG